MEGPLLWVGFFAFVAFLLALDLGVLNKKAHTVGLKEAGIWSVIWVGISLGLGGWIWWDLGQEKAVDFLTCYIIEKSLSVDNLFVFLAIFSFFSLNGDKAKYQHRVLFWGIIGAIGIRVAAITAGTALLSYMGWLIYVFGAFLAYKGVKMWSAGEDEEVDFSKNPVIRWFKRNFPVTDQDHGAHFFVREADANGVVKWHATPLFIILLIVEMTDVIFAVDSIPAIIGITQDSYILVTSNIMAILGLRALYFVLAAVNSMFCYLKYAMCMILVFVGAKMMAPALALTGLVDEHHLHVDKYLSLAVIVGLIFGSILLSVIWPMKENDEANGTAHK